MNEKWNSKEELKIALSNEDPIKGFDLYLEKFLRHIELRRNKTDEQIKEDGKFFVDL